MTNKNSTNPPTERGADALVRTGSPDPAPPTPGPGQTPTPRGADLQVCRVGIRADMSSPRAGLGKPSINREQSERVQPPNPSTGPKTQAGKSISSKNAVTHGLRAKKIENAVPPSLRQQYESLRRDYQNQYKPTGAIENTLFDLVVFAAWQLYKVREMALYADIDLGMMGSFGTSEKLARYRASHERLFFRSLNQFNKIQQERLLRETDQKAALPQNLPPGARLKTLQDHLKRLHRHPRRLTASANAPKSVSAPRKDRVSSQNIRP